MTPHYSYYGIPPSAPYGVGGHTYFAYAAAPYGSSSPAGQPRQAAVPPRPVYKPFLHSVGEQLLHRTASENGPALMNDIGSLDPRPSVVTTGLTSAMGAKAMVLQ